VSKGKKEPWSIKPKDLFFPIPKAEEDAVSDGVAVVSMHNNAGGRGVRDSVVTPGLDRLAKVVQSQ